MAEQSATDWKQAGQSFDLVADMYDQYRPGYPQELVESLIVMSGIPEGGRILEIGSGTGKATCLFASRGYAIHCIEPGRNMAAVAARNLRAYPAVTYEMVPFEEAREQPAGFDLVMSAQAFHWIPKETGYAKAARSLKPGGCLALFWNLSPGFQGQVATELDRIYHDFAPQLENPQNASEAAIQEKSDGITQSGCFGPATIQRFPWSLTYQTGEYLGLLNTYSDHLLLPVRARQDLFEAIAAAINAKGGLVEKNYIAVLYVAPKLSRSRRNLCADVSH